MDTIFFDFRKAFDTVPHQELLYKLWLIGITGPLWEWFREKISDVFLFADDMKFLHISYSHSDYISVQSDIDSLTEWSNEWKLQLNVNKCCHMSFSSLHEIEEGLTYQVDGVSLNNVDSSRDLGIIVTNNFSWQNTINLYQW